ncbi:MAG: hypothetical protein ABI442_02900, partial [Gemmatimonadaceae bacterium]
MAANTPEIWTYDQFKTETNPKDVRKALAAIDQYLKDWGVIKNGPSTEGKILHLRKISNACIDYVTSKQAKADKKAGSRFSKPSSRLVNRIAKAKQLAKQVFLRMTFEKYEYQKSVRSGPGTKMDALAGEATSVKGGYRNERTNFVNTKAAGNLGGTQTAINPQGGSFVHQRMEEHNADPVAAPPNILAMLAKSFDALTLQEFNDLQAHFSAGGQGLGALPNVHYARKDERLREMMLVPLDGLLYTSDGNICNAGWNGYAMDLYGNLLVAKANKSWNHGVSGAQFNHSTLTAGLDVVCAGEIKIAKGLVEYISNESGHYKPSAKQLANCIFALVEEYSLPMLDSVKDVVDVSSGNKLEFKGVLPFLAA